MIRVKRVYEKAKKDDGYRVLVDRLWPRGMTKEAAHVGMWMKEIAPSDALRRHFCHDVAKWPDFQKKYRAELANRRDGLAELKKLEREHGTLTLLYGAKDEEHNQAVVLAEVLKVHPASARGKSASAGRA
jgi:uncharacterized protein YeaO (DUF488 family)